MFKKRLRELRLDRQMSQQELAESLGVSRGAIGMYEQGKREPDSTILQRIADFFGVTVDYLLGRSNYRAPWEKGGKADIDLEEFVRNQSNIKLMGDPLSEETKEDVLLFLKTAHEFIVHKKTK